MKQAYLALVSGTGALFISDLENGKETCVVGKTLKVWRIRESIPCFNHGANNSHGTQNLERLPRGRVGWNTGAGRLRKCGGSHPLVVRCTQHEHARLQPTAETPEGDGSILRD